MTVRQIEERDLEDIYEKEGFSERFARELEKFMSKYCCGDKNESS